MEKNFYVITPIFNPIGYKTRIKLYQQFAQYMQSCNVKLITIELEYGKIPFEVTGTTNSNHIQLRTDSVLWHKEQLINLAVQKLPLDWEYIAWIDADIRFINENWVYQTIRALQFHPVVQMFSQALDLSVNNEVIRSHEGVGYAYQHNLLTKENTFKKMYQNYPGFQKIPKDIKYYHPGFAWAIRRDAFNNLGGLLDFAILGSADQHMAHAFVGQLEKTIHPKFSVNYQNKLKNFQQKCEIYIKNNLGYVPGSIVHYWHGSKKDRGYTTRFNILINHQFDPDKHLEKDWQGLYRWTDQDYYMHYDILRYFNARKEDLNFEV